MDRVKETVEAPQHVYFLGCFSTWQVGTSGQSGQASRPPSEQVDSLKIICRASMDSFRTCTYFYAPCAFVGFTMPWSSSGRWASTSDAPPSTSIS
jgi:hypothetical protein